MSHCNSAPEVCANVAAQAIGAPPGAAIGASTALAGKAVVAAKNAPAAARKLSELSASGDLRKIATKFSSEKGLASAEKVTTAAATVGKKVLAGGLPTPKVGLGRSIAKLPGKGVGLLGKLLGGALLKLFKLS